MFFLPQPSMALNSHNVPPPDYQMWQTYKVSKDTSAESMLAWTAKVASDVEGGLHCLVINCHGKPGRLKIGTHITPVQAPLFNALKGKVNTIFLVACHIAELGDSTSFDGNLFCGAVAKESGATVFCATDFQTSGAYTILGLPFGAIDEYEGLIYQYNRDGSNKPVTNDYIREYVSTLTVCK